MTRAAIVALLVGALAANTRAEEPATTLGLALSDCASLTTDATSLAVMLRLELRSSLATQIELLAGAPTTAHYQIGIDCTERADELSVRLARTTPPGEYRRAVGLGDVPRAMRARTLALAIAEDLRLVEAAPVAPPAPPRPSTITPEKSTLIAPTPPRPVNQRVLRFRDMSLGFGVPTATLLLVGSTLIAVGEGRADQSTRTQFASWGGTMLGFAVVGVIGASVSLGLWAKERRKAK